MVTLQAEAEVQADCRARGLPTTPIRVRLIRVPLPTCEVEVLMTSLLDAEDVPTEAFAELYHLRWAQEESYKRFKCRVEVENWSGKSALSIFQDFHAKVLALNLTAVLASTAQSLKIFWSEASLGLRRGVVVGKIGMATSHLAVER